MIMDDFNLNTINLSLTISHKIHSLKAEPSWKLSLRNYFERMLNLEN